MEAEVKRATRWTAGVLWMWVALALPLVARVAAGQESGGAAPTAAEAGASEGRQPAASRGAPTAFRTFYLRSPTGPFNMNDGNEMTQALRNMMDPRSKVYFVPMRSVILVEATPEQMALAEKILSDLDRPRRGYRITYTVSEIEDGRRIGVQHFSVEVVAGQRATLKQGSKVPVATGSYDAGKSQTQTQVTYLDVGMNFDVTLDESDAGVQLRSKIEQSSIAEEKSGVGPQDPVVRQTVLEGISRVQMGKPLVIGQLDVAGITRHLAIEVLVEAEKP